MTAMIQGEAHLRAVRAPGHKPALALIGMVLVATSAMMLLPMLTDIVVGNPDWQAFAASSALAAAIGFLLFLTSRGSLQAGLTLRQAFVLTPLSWFSVAAISALPFYFSDFGVLSGHAANSVFEAVSGITTTGGTVIIGLEHAPPGLLLWRALLQ